ncbi:MAG: hypothetical protein WD749_00785 [Phycisphaerales bacterium]
MVRPTRLVVMVAACGGAFAPAALAQVFTNADFETGDLSGWAVTPTFFGTTVVQNVESVDIDGPGPLEASFGARFRVGTAGILSTFQAGIELSQEVTLTAGNGYVFACDWAALNTSTGANSEGGVFTVFVDDRLLAGTQAAGSTSATAPHYGHIEGAFGPPTTGTYRVGIRITRPFTTGTSTLNQFVDNFTITPATVGACCLADGSCFQTRAADCGVSGGTYAGDSVTCAAAACVQPGACCVPDASCFIRSEAQCLALGGTYSGNGTTCAAAGCPDPAFGFAPIANRALDGGTSFNGPMLGGTTPAPRTIQFSVAASELAGIPAGSSITGLTWRQDNAAGNTTWPDADALFTQYDIELSSQGAASPGGMLPTLASNVGPDATVVRSGPLTIPAQGFPGGAGAGQVNPFGHEIAFSTPFVYSGGPLVVTIRHSGHDQPTNRNLDGIATNNATYFRTVQSLVATGAAATTGNSAVFNIVRFTVEAPGSACYANCDESTQAPVLNVADFGCFLTRYAAGEAYANCDESTQAPVLNVADFGCFLTKYAAGCP